MKVTSMRPEQDGSDHVKKNEKLCTKRVSESVSIFVCGHLSLCKDVKSIGTDDFLERKKLGKGASLD